MKKFVKMVKNKPNEYVDFALLDGYFFGDKLLEGLMFKVELVNDKPTVTGVYGNGAEAYFEQFNKTFWLENAQSYVDEMVEEGEVCFSQNVSLIDE